MLKLHVRFEGLFMPFKRFSNFLHKMAPHKILFFHLVVMVTHEYHVIP